MHRRCEEIPYAQQVKEPVFVRRTCLLSPFYRRETKRRRKMRVPPVAWLPVRRCDRSHSAVCGDGWRTGCTIPPNGRKTRSLLGEAEKPEFREEDRVPGSTTAIVLSDGASHDALGVFVRQQKVLHFGKGMLFAATIDCLRILRHVHNVVQRSLGCTCHFR